MKLAAMTALSLHAVCSLATTAAAQSHVDAGYTFLARQMDRFHRATPISVEPEFQAYYPSGTMGDSGAIGVGGTGSINPATGSRGTVIHYAPGKQRQLGWAGLAFQYPAGNWGKVKGRDLSGGRKLTLWARASAATATVEFHSGGTNRPAMAGLPHSDSYDKVWQEVTLGTQWTLVELELGDDLRSVISPLQIVFKADNAADRGIEISDAAIDRASLDEPRLVQSYVNDDCRVGATANTAHVYDASLVLLAFLGRGEADDRRRAGLIARALVAAQDSDRNYKDGRLRNAYASGELIDPSCACTRLPGEWNEQARAFREDEFAAGSDTGNLAWAALALVQTHHALGGAGNPTFLRAAQRLGRWIVENNRVEGDARGGFSGGREGFEPAAKASAWRSTEHNIDLVALFRHLELAVGATTAEGAYWRGQADHARRFVDSMRSGSDGAMHLWTGTSASGAANDSVIPLDAQTWAVLGMGQPRHYQAALDWSLRMCRAGAPANAFDFNCNDGDGAWFEGTAQVAAALRLLGRERDAAPILAALRAAQARDGKAAGAMPAASRCGLTTGYRKTWQSGQVTDWLYPSSPHIAATAWYLLAELGKNPYDVAAVLPPIDR